ncbi:MAG: hypothetical protein Q4F13_11225 [Pseudomonadota bacterium]|nr:hypothetical protein [Pseudomonadota bacterium]
MSWPDVVRHLGQEVATALNTAAEQLDRLNRLEPSLVRSLAPLSGAIERARQAGMAAQQVLRLHEEPPAQQREALDLAEVVRAVLAARGGWLTRHQVSVRQGLVRTAVFADASLLYMLVDELVMWAGGLSGDVAINVEHSSRSGRPRLRVSAWCQPASVPEADWHGMRWVLWHQLVRSVGGHARLDMHDDHVRVSVSLPEASAAQLQHGSTASAPRGVSAAIQGARVLVISASERCQTQCTHALKGYGVIIDNAQDMRQARQYTEHHTPDALVYDASVPAAKVLALRDELSARSSTVPALIAIDEREGAREFSASTIGTVSTGHVAASAIGPSLGPALVFELCKSL